MFDMITGKVTHIPSRSGAPIVLSTMLQAAIVAALLVPTLLFTGALPEPQMVMAFVAAPPPPPPPPPPPAPAPPKPEAAQTSRPALATKEAAPLEPPSEIRMEPPGVEEGVPGGVEGGVPDGVIGGVVGGLPEPPAPPPPPARKDPVRVGGQIQPPKLLKRVEPVYPPLAVSAHVQGLVILEAIVDGEGFVEDVRVLRTANAILDKSAIEAVKQWQYSPLVLNGIPARFVLTVMLSFNLTMS